MENITPIQKLDEVLKYFRLNDKNDNLQLENVSHFLRTNYDPDFTAEETMRIMHKLISDGYIRQLGYTYTITFDGHLFHGYQEQLRIENIKQTISENDELVRQRNDHRLVVGTWFAGIAAALLLLWQMFLYLYPVHAHYPYWIWETIPKK